MESNNHILIVAGGSGTRMGADIPKQFILLRELPILMHTINAFQDLSFKTRIVLVLPESQIPAWKELCKQHNFSVDHSIVPGGETRFQSVKNGLFSIHVDGLVAIHDGVRPLVSKEVIENCFNSAAKFGNAIPVIKPVESVRLVDELDSYPFNREKVFLVQTPQVFNLSSIKQYYQTPWQPSFTDDASVAEFCGEKIHLVDGNRENIKITTPLDLSVAEIFLRK